MSLRIPPLLRYCSAVGVTLATLAGAEARAADTSLPDAMTNAFETIVIDASRAASKATAAAKEALSEKGKQKRTRKSAKKKPAKDDSADKQEKEQEKEKDRRKRAAKPDPKPDGKSDQKDRKDQKPDSAEGKAEAKDTAANPSDKAAAGTKPADPKADAAKKPAIANEWPAADVELARARCTQLLKGVDAVTVPEPPFRKGDCGSMAPVRLISIGKNPEVALSPPAVVSCDMVVALTKWVKDDVQPAAKRHLGSEVIRIDSLSDYSCRLALGRVGNKLSEHGKANALDIRGFTTRKGDHAVVLTDWGETRRDALRQAVAAKVAAEKAAAAKAAAERAAKERTEVAEAAAKGRVTSLPRKTIAEGLSRKDGKKALAVPASVTKDDDLESDPSSLGGPKEAVLQKKDRDTKRKDRKRDASGKRLSREEAALIAALPPEEAANVKTPAPQSAAARFLREIHASGCRIFGTTLGPEANEAHRNHFHVDMAERKFRKICD